MFGSDPVDRSSRAKTSHPSASRSSARCEPMNPAPPVMSALGVFVSGVLNCRSLASSGSGEGLGDVLRARIEAQPSMELAASLRLPAGVEVGEPESEAELDLPRLLPHRGLERRDV